MRISTVLRKVQYQISKIEVIELLFWHTKNNQPSIETEMAHNMVATLRQNLFIKSEACFDASLETIESNVRVFQSDLNSATNLLAQMNHGISPTNTDVIFIKDLLSKIISSLSSLNSELSIIISQLYHHTPANPGFETYNQNFSFFENPSKPEQLETDHGFRTLVRKCMGDIDKVERLIQYEHRQSPELSRAEAIRFAITRWERDNS
ncbi:hypothetical protein [Synechococcus elongatus]|uniref:hypothetical protein n=1 Tax=Synechococcus elongatus TaxID=32046 RepID=UPI0030CCDEE3